MTSEIIFRDSKKMISEALFVGQSPNSLNDVDRLEDADDHLPGPRALRFVSETLFEQFGIRETDSQLIVQPVKKCRELRISRRHVERAPRAFSPCVYAPCGSRSAQVDAEFDAGSRQSVSTKIRTDPPAVLTYSTLPPAIQL